MGDASASFKLNPKLNADGHSQCYRLRPLLRDGGHWLEQKVQREPSEVSPSSSSLLPRQAWA